MIRKLAQLEQHLIWSRRGDSLYEPFLHYLQQIYVAPSQTSLPRWPESGGWISRRHLRSDPEFVHKMVFKRCWRQIRGQSDPMIETFTRDGIEYTVDLRQRISYWLYAMGQFGRYVIDAMRTHLRPGDIVFDIGANTGSTTLPLARAVSDGGRIYSFEPNPGAFDLLSENVTANGFEDRVFLNNFALGDSDETMTLRVPEFNDGAASLLESWKSIGGRTKVEVEIKSFPNYWESAGFPRARLVKVDVEGYEPVLLAAMTDFLRDVHPILVLEVTPSVPGYRDMFENLEALKYTVMEIKPNGRLDPVDVRKAEQFDVICLPR